MSLCKKLLKKLEYSAGNLKVPRSTMIINMGPAANCPAGKKDLCKFYKNKKCYAMKAERAYKESRAFRKRQAEYWQSTPADQIAAEINAIQERKRKPFKNIRFNEAGDFYNQKCVKKLSRIADLVNIPIYTYTSRRDLKFDNLSNNLVITGSGFMVHNNFKVVPNPKGRYICARNCRICNLCKKRRGIIIEAAYH